MIFPFKGMIFMFHLSFRGSNTKILPGSLTVRPSRWIVERLLSFEGFVEKKDDMIFRV